MTKDCDDTKEGQEGTKEMKGQGMPWPGKAERGGDLKRKSLKSNIVIFFS